MTPCRLAAGILFSSLDLSLCHSTQCDVKNQKSVTHLQHELLRTATFDKTQLDGFL